MTESLILTTDSSIHCKKKKILLACRSKNVIFNSFQSTAGIFSVVRGSAVFFDAVLRYYCPQYCTSPSQVSELNPYVVIIRE